MFNMGMWDWAIIAGIVLLLFGGKKLPEFGRALGEGIREFKKALQGKPDSEEKNDRNKPTLS